MGTGKISQPIVISITFSLCITIILDNNGRNDS